MWASKCYISELPPTSIGGGSSLKNLTKEMQKEVFLHEVEHILYDMPEKPYIIGVDMQYSEMEKRADSFVRDFKKVNNF